MKIKAKELLKLIKDNSDYGADYDKGENLDSVLIDDYLNINKLADKINKFLDK